MARCWTETDGALLRKKDMYFFSWESTYRDETAAPALRAGRAALDSMLRWIVDEGETCWRGVARG